MEQASDYLNDVGPAPSDVVPGTMGTETPTRSTAARLWQNSARTIGDILMLSELVDPFAYHALPFANQPLFVAGSCYIKEAEDRQRQVQLGAAASGGSGTEMDSGRSSHTVTDIAYGARSKTEIFATLLNSVMASNIAALQQGLTRQARYWSGVAWVAGVLSQRWAGVRTGDIDLQSVTEGLATSLTVPDARLFGRSKRRSTSATDGTSNAADFNIEYPGWPSFGDAAGLPAAPQDPDWLADADLLRSQGFDISTEDFFAGWMSNLGGT